MAAKSLIFVREKHTFKFLNRRGAWVASFDDAAIFRHSWQAYDFCFEKSVHDADIVLRLGDPSYDVSITVPDAATASCG